MFKLNMPHNIGNTVTYVLRCVECTDYIEFDAQVPTSHPRGSSERHLQHAVERVQHVHVRRDVFHRRHRLPERTDYTAQDRSQSIRQRLSRQQPRKTVLYNIIIIIIVQKVHYEPAKNRLHRKIAQCVQAILCKVLKLFH